MTAGSPLEFFAGGGGSRSGRRSATSGGLLGGQFLDRGRQLAAEADLAVVGIDPQDLDLDRLANLDLGFGVVDLVLGEFRDVQQPFEVVLELHEDTEVGDLRDRPGDNRTGLVATGDVGFPRVLLQLLHAQGNPLAVLVDREDLAADLVPLLQHLAGVRHLAGPRHVRDVQQAVDALFNLDEGTVVGEIPNGAIDDGADGVPRGDHIPRVGLGLLHAQRDFLLLLVDGQHHHVDLVANLDQLGGVIDPAGPRHLADVDQPLDARLEADEGTVGHDVHDLAAGLGPHRELLLDHVPRAGLLLLEPEGDLFFLVVDVEDHHLELVVDLDHLVRMADAAVAHVGDVQQPVDATQVDERAEVGDVLDDTLADLADLELLQQFLLELRPLVFDELAARNHDVPAGFVDLQDHALDLATDVVANVGGPADIDLAGGQEDMHADVDQQATLDLPHDGPGDHIPFLAGGDDLFPVADPLRLPPRQLDDPLLVIELFEQNFDLLAGDRGFLPFVPLGERHNPFALAPHVEEHVIPFAAQHHAREDLARFKKRGVDNHPVEPLPALDFHHRREDRIQFVLVDGKFTNKIAIDHGTGCA